MVEAILLLLAYALCLDWLARKIGADDGRLPWIVRRQSLARRARASQSWASSLA